jgi:predicted nuclease of predicted toxin-antitoxin system
MRFLVDECTGPAVAAWLRALGHDVFSAYNNARGSSDDDLLARAFVETRILITNDRDFGIKVFRKGQAHCGIIFLRLKDERRASKIAALTKLLDAYANQIPGAFVVVSESQVRFARA